MALIGIGNLGATSIAITLILYARFTVAVHLGIVLLYIRFYFSPTLVSPFYKVPLLSSPS